MRKIAGKRGGGGSKEAAKAKNPAAVALGRLGGLKGGPALAAKMTPKQRSLSARRAALARWSRVKAQATKKTVDTA